MIFITHRHLVKSKKMTRSQLVDAIREYMDRTENSNFYRSTEDAKLFARITDIYTYELTHRFYEDRGIEPPKVKVWNA